MLVAVAPCAGGLMMRAWSAPGGTMSPAYFAFPVTFSTASRRGADVPTTVKLVDGLQRRRRLQPAFDPLAAGQLPVGHALAPAAGDGDGAARDLQVGGRDAENRSAASCSSTALRLGRGRTQHRPELTDG